jgi:AmiR/NasT family two-component response regulator
MVIDRDPLATHVLCQGLTAAGAIVVACGRSGQEGVELARVNSPDLVFVDRSTDAAAVIDELIALELGMRLIVIAAAEDVAAAIAAIRAGARGWVAKADLLESGPGRVLRAAMSDELVCSRRIVSAILARLTDPSAVGAA